MKNTFLFVVIFGLLSIVWSCKPSLEVIPVSGNDTQIKKNGIIYHLPRTVFEIEVNLTHEIVIPGPFHKYANKYLSITNVPYTEEESYTISDIKIKPITEPDPNAAFLVKSKQTFFPAINLLPNNIILGVNLDDFYFESESESESDATNTFKVKIDDLNEPYFTDISVKRNFINMLDTTYKVVEIDSVYQKIPVYNTVIISKDLEQKAEEAANYIIKIRKRRFKLEAGMYEVFPDGKALKKMLKELDELEQEYLSLFIGKRYEFNHSYKEIFTPDKQIEDKKIILFWFSEEDGISKEETAVSRPINLTCKALPQTTTVDVFYKQQQEFEPKYNGFYYRIPGKCRLTIMDADYCFADQRFDVAQYGIINSLPCQMFKKTSPVILFDANYGSIINIK
jgi:hypothetical protein